MRRPKIITIDGPAGAGKSTVAKKVAELFGYFHLDSGAIYRAIGYACKEKGVNLKDEKSVLKVAKGLSIQLKGDRVYLNGVDVTNKIRTPQGGVLASQVAQFPSVRELVVKLLREMAEGKEVVIDGRDAGSYIFPDAPLKIYLTAAPEERARRRFKELKKKGFNVSYQEILKEIIERDEKDRNRSFAPLTVPEGAVVIDTTGKSLEQVLFEVEKLINDP